MLFTTQTAYLDPSVMTYAIQAIAGIVVAIGAVVIVYWRKAKKKVSDKLGIEERQTKEVEEDIKIIDEEAATAEADVKTSETSEE